MTRWQQFYLEDERVLAAPPSLCAQAAVQVFQREGKRTVLDLACGVGRDTLLLAEAGLSMVGADAAESGLVIARRRGQDSPADVSWIMADARRLPFAAGTFEGVYCFGLLHEYTGASWEQDVRQTMTEIERVLLPGGVLILAVLAGDPEKGLPHVRLFSEPMFDAAVRGFRVVEKTQYPDIGCTGCEDYRVWRGVLVK